MSKMTEALERINLRLYGRFKITKPGMSLEEIESRLSFFPYRLSDEAYEFYQWSGAPTGDSRPDDWNGSYNDSSTYNCALERLLERADDIIHFQSLEEMGKIYSPLNASNPEWLPIISAEYSHFVISGSQTQIDTSPVLIINDEPKLWFPSLTDMMLAIAESIEATGTILPGWFDDPDDEDYGTDTYDEKIREKCSIVKAIARKYGSPEGVILSS